LSPLFSSEAAAGEGGFEAITVDDTSARLFAVEETSYELSDSFQARVQSFSSDLQTKLSDQLLDFEFDSKNKGVEGAAIVSSGNTKYLLALCEGNGCRSGDAGKKPGGGTILVYYRANSSNSTSWVYNDKIRLPDELDFIDYSGLDVRLGGGGGQGRQSDRNGETDSSDGAWWDIAVVSQESSALFWGALVAETDESKPSGVDWKVFGTTGVYKFPSGYCNIEGIAFLNNAEESSVKSGSDDLGKSTAGGEQDRNDSGSDRTDATVTYFAVVSDKSKSSQPASCVAKDQSVHLFRLRSERAEIFAVGHGALLV
jgi:hypothetical protein